MRAAFDLGAFAAALKGGTGPRERFKAAVRRCRGIHAELMDLRTVSELMGLLSQLTAEVRASASGVPGRAQGLQSRALLMSAIIHYVRATHTRSNHKPDPRYEAVFTDRQLQQHRQIIALRDDALAHWGPGEDWAGGLWHDNRVVLARAEDGEEGVANPSYQTNVAAQVAGSLRELASAATASALKQLTPARIAVTQTLEALFLAESDASELAEQYPFDPGEFFGGRADLVDAFWARRDAAAN